MRPGTTVYAARATDTGVEVERAKALGSEWRYGEEIVLFDRPLFGKRHCFIHAAHASKAAALLALEERLREQARAEREKAAEHTVAAERLLVAADRARKMAEGR